jgi:hypothetical protein
MSKRWLIGGAVAVGVVMIALVACQGGADHDVGVVQEWVASYEGTGSGSAAAVATDGQGNLYAAGSWWTGRGQDYLTVKYDAEGEMLWSALYNGSGNADDTAEAVAVDGAGNVYVAGNINQTTQVPPTGNYGLVKYDASGVEQWVAAYTLGRGYDWLTALALDGQGNVYVSGFSDGGEETREDIVTIKYDANGNQLWVARYNGPSSGADEAWAMVGDGAGNVYVTGATFSDSNVSGDFLTVKYDADGIEQWVARYDGPSMGDDSAHAIAVDGAGNVCVTGRVTGSGPRYSTVEDYATVKYDAKGNQLWVAIYGAPEGGNDSPEDVAVDDQGNVHVAGEVNDLFDVGPDYGTIKYDASGSQLWVAVYNGPGHREFGSSDFQDGARALALDEAGNVYVTGSSRIDGSGTDWVTIKYDPSGRQEWLARYGGSDDSWDRADALAIDESGNVYVAGIADPDGFTVVKYSQEPSAP